MPSAVNANVCVRRVKAGDVSRAVFGPLVCVANTSDKITSLVGLEKNSSRFVRRTRADNSC
jgi:hypothetical protein